jgi:hypothetical protein
MYYLASKQIHPGWLPKILAFNLVAHAGERVFGKGNSGEEELKPMEGSQHALAHSH